MTTVKRVYFRDVDLSKITVKPNEKSKSPLGKEYSHFYPDENGVNKPFKYLADEAEIVWGIQLEYTDDDKPKADKDKSRCFQLGCTTAPIIKTSEGKYSCANPDAANTLELFEFKDKLAARILELVQVYNPKAFYENTPIRSPHEKDSEKVENYTLHCKLAGTGSDIKPGVPREEYECWSRFRDSKNNNISLDKFTSISKAACVIPAMDCSSSFCAKKNNALSLRVRGDDFLVTIKGTNPGERIAPIVDVSQAKRTRIAPPEEEEEQEEGEVQIKQEEQQEQEEQEQPPRVDDPLMF